jgi:5,10-methylenetetrahydromethanopterin reductase
MKFGFCHVPSEHYAKHVELVRRAEDLGFDYAWIPDQTFYRDPYVILAALALSTSKIRLGLGVTNPYTRHPAAATRAIASVEEIAPSRVSFGVGAGNVRELLHPLGFDFAAPAARCKEEVELVRAALSGEEVEYRGRHFQMVGARLEINGSFPIPLYIAGRGRRVLEAAGEVADGALVGGLCNAAGFEYAIGCLRRGAQRAGRDLAQLEVGSWVGCHVTDDPEAAAERLKPSVAHIIGGAPNDVLEEIGLPMATVAAIKAAYADGGSAAGAAHVTRECIDAFTIVGDASTVVERIRMLEDAGATQFIFLMHAGSVDEHAQRLERFASDVIPAV